MRRLLFAIRTTIIIAACIAAAVFALLLSASPVFAEGESYELYLGASSSANQLVTDHPLRDKLTLPVVGESVRYEGNRARELAETFHARLLFIERAGDIVNCYYYSEDLGNPVLLDGYAVNLHIALSAEQTAVGTPLIFGGF